MKKILVILLVFIGSSIWAQEEATNKASSDKLKVLILNLNNKSDISTYGSSDALQPVIFNSLYNFIGIIPSLDIPDQKVLQRIRWNSTNIAQIAQSRGVDLIVYGDYSFSGPAYDPRARLNLKIFSSESVVDILSRSYNSSTDLEIFDTIDLMINDLSVELLKGKVEVAYLNFTGFETGNELYDIYVNDKIIASISNTYFDLNLKILAKTTYEVEIVRKFDKKTIHDSSFVLQPGFTAKISHRAQATLDLKALKGKKKGSAYTFLLNSEAIQDDQLYTNLQGGKDYTFVVLEDGTNMAYSNNFYLHDGGKKTLKPRVKGATALLSLMLSINDESILQSALIWHLHPKMWLAGGLGVSYLPAFLDPVQNPTNILQSPFFLNTYLGFGYTIVGDMDSAFRVGADLSVHYTVLSSISPGFDPGINTRPLSVGLFVSAEWKSLFLKVGTYYDIFNKKFFFDKYPVITAGVKLRFGGVQYDSPGGNKSAGSSFKPGWGVQLGINDQSMLQAGLNMELSPKFWMSLGTGASLWPASMVSSASGTTISNSIFFLNPYYSLGYHILGGTTQDFRLGAELTVRYVAIANIPDAIRSQLPPGTRVNTLSVGPFIRAEWKILYLKAGYYLDLMNDPMIAVKYPVISGGVVLRF